MSVNDSILAYRSVAEKAFTPKHWISLPASPKGTYSASALEHAIKRVIKEQCQEENCQGKKAAGEANSCTHTDKLFRTSDSCKTYDHHHAFLPCIPLILWLG